MPRIHPKGFNKKLIKTVEKIDPWALLNHLESYLACVENDKNIRERNIQKEYDDLKTRTDICKSSAEKYIKQMKKEAKIFEQEEKIYSKIIDEMKSGQFTVWDDGYSSPIEIKEPVTIKFTDGKYFEQCATIRFVPIGDGEGFDIIIKEMTDKVRILEENK